MVYRLQAVSPDFWLAKAEEYHQEHYEDQTWMLGEAQKYKVKTKEEDWRPQRERTKDAKEWDYLVSERELNQIKKHVLRAQCARGLRDHQQGRLPQISPSKALATKTSTLEDKKPDNIQTAPKVETQKHRVAWAKEQIKGHQGRMIRGRELTEQRNAQGGAQKVPAQAPPFSKSQVEKEEVKEFEWVTAYPIVQPHQEAPIEVTILMEKSKESKLRPPPRREFLSIPPFLKRQLEENYGKITF